MPDLIAEFRLSHSMGGLLYALPIIMIAAFSYPLGILSDRIGMEASIRYGISIAFLFSLLRAFVGSFGPLVVCTGLFGIGFALCFPNLPKLVKEKFPPRYSGAATGAYTAALPLGTGLAIILTRRILPLIGTWRHVLLLMSLATVPVVLLWWIGFRPPVSRRKGLKNCLLPETSDFNEGNNRAGRLPASLLICGLLLALLNMIFYCTIGWLPTYLTERAWPAARAATATSLISFIEIPAILLIPLLVDRVGRRRLAVISSFAWMSACSAVISGAPSLAWFTIPCFGITLGGVFVLLLAIPVDLVEAKKVGRAAGIVISIGYAGALIGPPTAGYLRDLTGSFAGAFLATALIGVTAAGLSYWLPSSVPRTRANEERANSAHSPGHG